MTKQLSDLTASELARLDAICLEFEDMLRKGVNNVDDLIASFLDRFDGSSSEMSPDPILLKQELELVAREYAGDDSPRPVMDASRGAFGLPPVDDTPGASTGSAGTATSPPANGPPQSGSAGISPTGHKHQAVVDDGLPHIGDTIGPYIIDGELGRGGMGIVFRATDTRLDRVVAIKMLSVGGKHHAELVERFQREAKAVAKIVHPNIVELFDVGQHNGLPYAVMEFLHGETLVDRFKQARLSTDQVRQIGVQIASALATCHASGVIHRDLKPHNVMLMHRSGGVDSRMKSISASSVADEATLVIQPDDSPTSGSGVSVSSRSNLTVKLFDFGLSRVPRGGLEVNDALPADADSPIAHDASTQGGLDDQTRAGLILGTPGYMSPEQARGEAVTPAADLFGLGCVLYEAFYGRRAFEGETSADRFAASLHKEPLYDPMRRRDDPELAEIIERCLAKSVDDRPSSAAEVAEALRIEPVADPSGSSISGFGPPPVSDATFGRRRFVESLMGGAAGLIIGGLWHQQLTAAMYDIRSLGVLTFVERGKTQETQSLRREDLGERIASEGEQLSQALVNELSKVKDLTVAKFFPLYAQNPKQYQAAARELDVDALVDGQFRRISDDTGQSKALEINLQIISGDDGKQLWGDTVLVAGGDNLLERKTMASALVKAIGRGLSSTRQSIDGLRRPKDPEVLCCLNKGEVSNDPDNVGAMRKSLACFQHALEGDPEYAESHAGVALMSVSLAGRVDGDECVSLVNKARDHIRLALTFDPDNMKAKLARAMIDWQIDFNYEPAYKALEELAPQYPNAWQVYHQWGLLSLTMSQNAIALQQLRMAVRLAPRLQSAKADVARAQWLRGQRSRASKDAQLELEERPTDVYARGLLIDLHEQIEDFAAAAAVDPEFGSPTGAVWNRSSYQKRRAQRLSAIPYGPFGKVSNQILFWQRFGNTELSSYEQFHLWSKAQSPSLPFLLARHPALLSMRTADYGREVLPRGFF
ncbi:serine/threonine-protein kinase [Crateriforma conspicua]|uniref:Serine/threonine-protein kinase Pkn1 n=1 Tax=Crateriforma conspicua TaxID=2527996 RepID=A0A5C6FTC2_9PLAN|nr:serine/threonine-protein kinase [Crateriforma conspicua]TWU66247.1 Serine/threonine-protein kinase Pkn1 [Crateriforma conspicua]